MMLKKRLYALLLAVMMLLSLTPAHAQEGENLLVNASFEELGADGMPVGWRTEGYYQQAGYSTFGVSSDARDGEISAVVNNIALNDARFAQTVEVVPCSLYCLSGWIKVDGMLDSGYGANLSVEGVYAFSPSVFEADGEWHYVELYGETDEDQYEVTVFARVGGYSGESQGKAFFDDLALREVEGIPGDTIAKLWFRTQAPVSIVPIEEEASGEAAPFWPWLLVIAAAYMACVWLVGNRLMLDRRSLRDDGHASLLFWGGMALAAVLRLIVASCVNGYEVDVNCFTSWGNSFVAFGPTQFYQSVSFCDYTPAYLYAMGLSDLLSDAGYSMGLTLMNGFYHKLIPMLCDLACAYCVYRFGREEKLSRTQAEIMGLLTAFSPALFINSAAWCQIDSVLCLGLLLVGWLAVQKKWAVLMPVYVLCALIKPQALMLGPLGLAVIVLEWIRHRDQTRQMLIGIGSALAVAAVIVIPFSIHQEPGWLINKYADTLASYPYATVNTANLYYLFNANWVSITLEVNWLVPVCLAAACVGWGVLLLIRQKPLRLPWAEPVLMGCFALAYLLMALLGATWGTVGFVTMGLAFAIVLPMFVRSGNVRHVPLLGGVLFILLYVLGVKMHERYLFPALVLLACAMLLHRDKRILLLLGLTTCTLFINEGIILDNSIRLGSNMGHLNADTATLAKLLSLVNLFCAGLSVWTAHRICVENCSEELYAQPVPALNVSRLAYTPCTAANFTPDASLHWTRRDWIIMLAVTAVYAAVCLCNLGSTKAPQNAWTSTAYNESVTIDLGEKHKDFSMLYFAQVSYSDFSVAVSDDGESWSEEYWAEMNEGECFRWKYLSPFYTNSNGTRSYTYAYDLEDVQRLSGRYVRITAQQISLALNEVIFRDVDGNAIPATVVDSRNANPDSPVYSDPANLLDEQDTLDGEPGWYTGTYFDEIYHARTAFEHLNGTRPYETSHPPLGKVIMSWFVGLFGMTPFGWRFAGALAGILMLPAMYLLCKQLTKRTDLAFTAMALMTLDCMHFTQTRIATIDSFPVLFIILSYWFMARFMQRDIVLDPLKKVLPDLALSGFFMGCSVASKWIGAYAGIGLAVLYFWTCARHLRLCGSASALVTGGDPAPEHARRIRDTLRRLLVLCMWCLLFFVAVPLTIYLLSYVPYFAYTEMDGLADFLSHVWEANFDEVYGMLAYHSEPGRGMDHAFYSPWYEWPLIKRPMYYAMAQFVPEGYSYSIFSFGNPAVWIIGLAGLAATLWLWSREHFYTLDESASILHVTGRSWDMTPAFVLIGFLAQFLPWVLVPRGTYIYHYFGSIPFLILAIVLMLRWISLRNARLGKVVLYAYVVVCLVFFIAFYPYASGVVTPEWWLDFMKQFLRVYHA